MHDSVATVHFVFLDALDPKPRAGEFFAELMVSYQLQVAFAGGLVAQPRLETVATLRLPVTTPPSQLPRLVSTEIALSPYVAADDYSSTESRSRLLWPEFEQPAFDPQDAYFLRILANAPDPPLTDETISVTRTAAAAGR